MTFNIRQLDNLDYDDIEPILENYIHGAIQAFVDSEVGQEYVETHPQGGNWIGTFIEMAYLYGEHKLPKMTKGDVQEVMEYILPRKLTLLDPSDTDDTIDELVAFWTFLNQAYKLRSANAIIKYLRSIEDQFPQWMFDPNRGGMTKSFMLQGMEAGYDMTSEEGIRAFQEEYNRNPQPMPMGMPGMPGMPPGMGMPGIPANFTMTTPPADMKAAFEQLGLELPKEGEQVNAKELITQFLGALAAADPDAAEELVNSLDEEEEDAPAPPPSPGNALQEMRRSFMRESLQHEFAPLAEPDQSLLQEQTFTETSPGTILKDFQTTLDFIGDGVPVSGKLQQLSAKLLGDLNSRLSHPVELDMKRPVQKSYPNIHGLYLLLRATGITEITAKGKQLQMVLNPEVHASWQQLNPTEKYFTLLEAWIVRGHAEMLGDDRSGHMTMGDRVLNSWFKMASQKSATFKDYKDYDLLNYYPGFENLLLMEMFGLVNLTFGKPAKGKGWRMTKLQPTDWGHALVKVLYNTYMAKDLLWASQNDPTQPFGELQPVLQPYFPEWQQNLATITYPFRPGRHIFKVSLGKCWRRIAISGEATLGALSSYILDSVEFDHDHLDQFTYQAPNGRKVEVTHPWADDGCPSTDDVQIGSLPLHEGSTMEYVFDFGDWWQFQVQLETVEPEATLIPVKGAKVKRTKSRKSSKHPPLGEIIEVHGEAPEQYPGYDEDW
jgi:hypothetical protein